MLLWSPFQAEAASVDTFVTGSVAVRRPLLHNVRVNDPFSGRFVGVSSDQVFAAMAPAVSFALTQMNNLADTISEVTAGTLQAVIDVRDRSTHDVTAHLLLAGAATVLAAHRPSFRTLGQQMKSAINATEEAWTGFGATGKWEMPLCLKPLAMPTPTLRVALASARHFDAAENASSSYAEEILYRVRSIGDSYADTARNTFSAALRHELPVGELADAVDVTMVEHTRLAAELATALQRDIHCISNAMEASYQEYRHTGLWAAPHVIMTAPTPLREPALCEDPSR
ncbi:Uncharacterised protein [Mycobacteroides abscessus subsp. massiliense]|nr:Uncharacterised protein [Mycobacteroides abscessus subsp. massiliense]SKG41312.1 Uncharacterised protein [Mycobacteroides abscessus subsp. massiliense]SKT41620.1 Uncharacterised protein [Mycobacteroides abscessus subsp. massiliense]SKT95233.1 Uncharacterised protein [Mycobacteroides abscessus subsp. massiliense]